MQANAGHILIPLDENAREWGFHTEYEKSKKPWRRPWRFQGEKILPGKVLRVTNLSFTDEKGEKKTWDPLYVAVHYLKRAQDKNADVIRVITPEYKDKPGNAALADCQITVKALQEMPRLMPQFFEQVKKGEMRLEEEAVSEMPTRWRGSDDGVFHPEG